MPLARGCPRLSNEHPQAFARLDDLPCQATAIVDLPSSDNFSLSLVFLWKTARSILFLLVDVGTIRSHPKLIVLEIFAMRRMPTITPRSLKHVPPLLLKQRGRSSFREGRLSVVLAHGLSPQLSQRNWVFHLSCSLAFLRWVMSEEASFALRARSF